MTITRPTILVFLLGLAMIAMTSLAPWNGAVFTSLVATLDGHYRQHRDQALIAADAAVRLARPFSILLLFFGTSTWMAARAGRVRLSAIDRLQALKLTAMATAWTEQQQNAELTALGFDERFGLLVDAEWLARENKRLARAFQEAKLKLPHACIEAIDYPARRELDKAVIARSPAERERGRIGFDFEALLGRVRTTVAERAGPGASLVSGRGSGAPTP